ncbi:flagellar biosynthesis anti-sigma factor FlgM [Paenibacillus doosanensis]|uniref:flagellar biosynthesis anti-sigma factor FlgM n=1 Tax=Paenibacillus doosanensis TaxID=1229154 RepID=UPI002180565A|nr:flagellar biosynthesis anti-sigma factor FlgM [Paenibacillus doosanensis]MCS7459955.1 flagellar biosynthesis anti-sigma factor FlgM [Paenibacillus doosanensis]
MKIDGTNRLGGVNPYAKSQDAYHAAVSGKTGKKKDKVEISSEAKELLETQNSAAAEKSREKVEALKASVASGTYKVDARALAEKLFPFIK